MPVGVVASHMSWPSFAVEAVAVEHVVESSVPPSAVAAVAPVVAVTLFDRCSVAVVCKRRPAD